MRPTVPLILLFALGGCEACDVSPLSLVPDPGQISGRLCDPADARGILGARVWVVLEYGDGTSRELETRSDEEGRFLLAEIPVGEYDVFIARGSFRAEVSDVLVVEGETTALAEDEACLAPDVRFRVYDGHDRVEEVLDRLGYPVTDLVDTRHDDHDESTPSWLVESFGEYTSFKDEDILFINCASHEWALDNASPDEVAQVVANLRRFIAEGGSLYLSDWAYDLLELLYPEAVTWYGDDAVRNDAQRGIAQIFVGAVVDEELTALLGRDRAALRYDTGRIAVPVLLGPGARPMIEADIEVRDEDGTVRLLTAVPVLFEFRPLLGGAQSPGRVIFTTFHNGATNTEAMDEVLRAIVYSL
jgi:SAM-dependent methyltransferase